MKKERKFKIGENVRNTRTGERGTITAYDLNPEIYAVQLHDMGGGRLWGELEITNKPALMEAKRDGFYQKIKTGQFVKIYTFAIHGITEEPLVVYNDATEGGTFVVSYCDFLRDFQESSLEDARAAIRKAKNGE